MRTVFLAWISMGVQHSNLMKMTTCQESCTLVSRPIPRALTVQKRSRIHRTTCLRVQVCWEYYSATGTITTSWRSCPTMPTTSCRSLSTCSESCACAVREVCKCYQGYRAGWRGLESRDRISTNRTSWFRGWWSLWFRSFQMFKLRPIIWDLYFENNIL